MKTLLFISAVSLLNATTIFIGSDAFSTTNNSLHATVDLSGTLHPNPSWAAPLPGSEWISYGPTGDHDDPGYFSPANGTLVTFTTQFTLSGLITGVNLTVLADDSTSVVLNGHTLIAAHTSPGSKCSGVAIGCLVSTEGVFGFAALSPYLVDGTNTLSFGVLQVAGSSYGVDFAGKVDDGTPEPATLALISGGLLGLAVLRRSRYLLI
jgi:hypothetical protein